MTDSGSNIADHDKIRVRAVFVADGETVDHTLLEGMSDPVMLRAELTLDEDEESASGKGSSPATSN